MRTPFDSAGELEFSRTERRLRQVLDGLRFPARKWQIIAQTDLYGADVVTRTQLYDLPDKEYGSCAEVAAAVNHATGVGHRPRISLPRVRRPVRVGSVSLLRGKPGRPAVRHTPVPVRDVRDVRHVTADDERAAS